MQGNNNKSSTQIALEKLGHSIVILSVPDHWATCYWCKTCRLVYYVPLSYPEIHWLKEEFSSKKDAETRIKYYVTTWSHDLISCNEAIIKGIIK